MSIDLSGLLPDPDAHNHERAIMQERSTALYTDLYHLDAAYVAWKSGQNQQATFDLYTRRAPFGGAFMLVAGLQPTLEYLADFRYTDEQISYIRRLKHYDPAFLDVLANLRFTGEILAMPEGTIAFPNEPLLRVTGPFIEALILESGLLRTVGISTLIATKAARLFLAAEGRALSDFSFRRAHNAFIAARSSYIGGCDSTSFVAAAMQYNMPSAGTIPHALVQAFSSEEEAFRAVAEAMPVYSLLLDTYDVPSALATAIRVGQWSQAQLGHTLGAVRLDSGDLAADSKTCRAALDAAGLIDVKVLVSGDLDEFRIRELLHLGAPVDGFGVGGNLGVGLGSIESGTVGGVIGAVYKLAWYDGDAFRARIKMAGTKSTTPGRKAAYRFRVFDHDIVQLDDEPAPAGAHPLLEPVVQHGRVVVELPELPAIRQKAEDAIRSLPPQWAALIAESQYPVEESARLKALRQETMEHFSRLEEEDQTRHV